MNVRFQDKTRAPRSTYVRIACSHACSEEGGGEKERLLEERRERLGLLERASEWYIGSNQ